MNVLKNVSEISKNTSEAVKNFHNIIDSILQPKGIDIAIFEGHKKIIEKAINGEEIDYNLIAFLSGYKKMIKEFKRCKNVADIAASMITENARPQNVEDDWFDFFFDKVRLTSDDKIQNMWAKILAEEVNTPNTFSRSLIHTLSVMSSKQVALFCNIARFCMCEYKKEENISPLIFISSNIKAYENSGIIYSELLELQQLGLLNCNLDTEWVFLNIKMLRHGNKIITIYGDPNYDEKIKAGNVIFTNDGKTLYSIISYEYKEYNADILDFTLTKFRARNCRVLVNGKEV